MRNHHIGWTLSLVIVALGCTPETASSSADKAARGVDSGGRCLFGDDLAFIRYATSVDVDVEERLSRQTSLSNVEVEQIRIATNEPELAAALEITEDRGPVRRARLVDHSTDDRYTMIDDGSIGDCTVRELAPASSAECLFGSSTVQMARLVNDLIVGEEEILSRSTHMTDLQGAQIMAGMGVTSLSDAFVTSDDNVLRTRLVEDRNTGRQYTLYVFAKWDGFVGFIFERGNMRRAATIGNGRIVKCTAEFEGHDVLPWAY